MNFLFYFIFSLIISSCVNAKTKIRDFSDFKIDKSFINGLKKDYYHITEEDITRQPKYENLDRFRPEKLLPQIHPWFEVGIGLETQIELGQGYRIFFLKPIPKQVLASLSDGLIQQNFTFAVLTKTFWQLVKEQQLSNMRIGFLSFDSDRMVSGVTFHNNRIIGLNIFSEPGTLFHEIQHIKQFENISDQSSNELIRLNENYNRSCISKLSMAIAELDATEKEMVFYLTLMDEFDFDDLIDSSIHSINIPQKSLFLINMHYPEMASDWIIMSDCSKEIKDIFNNISSLTYVSNQKSLNITSNMKISLVVYLKYLKNWNEKCLVNTSSENCEEIKNHMETLKSNFNSQKASFPKIFLENMEGRKLILKENLSLLAKSETEFSLLCRSVAGFKFLVDCP